MQPSRLLLRNLSVTQIVESKNGWTPLYYASEGVHLNMDPMPNHRTRLYSAGILQAIQWRSPTTHCLS